MHWQTADPFLFCAHHKDDYPEANEALGPAASLAERKLGMDFEGIDGWRMYHGEVVPGFPQHPHRGFETLTLARSGFIDHSDSLGATARFGPGDAQWMTAGAGIVHAEMFPLLSTKHRNPVELFQIWLNLPSASKMVEPYFTMLWSHQIPVCRFDDEAGLTTEVSVIAGSLNGEKPPAPPPDSWASRPEADVAVLLVKMQAGASWTLPAAAGGSSIGRTLYFFAGSSVRVGEHNATSNRGMLLRADVPATLVAGDTPVECLLLQGRPIGEPVAHHGPFVMNTPEELQQAFVDYQRTNYGGWPWPSEAPVHGRHEKRFARHADGRLEKMGE